ncbi:hypothetical protein GBA52_028370 [Prunus armeniaca]|nr:hypothetical protein GBA52_028370 [Prunus armeniaca]
MEDYILIKTLTFSLVSLILYSVGRVVQVYWLRPKSLEKQLRQQGIRGRSYKLFQDDMKRDQNVLRGSMVQTHVPQAPDWSTLGWFETRPRLIVAEPELIKLILADKSGHMTKPPLNPLVSIFCNWVSLPWKETNGPNIEKAHNSCFPS